MSEQDSTKSGGNVAKFVIMSLLGVFLFMALLPTTDADGYAIFNIPLGFAINWVGLTLNAIEVNGFGLVFLLALIVITVSLVGTILAYTVKPSFIMDNEKLKNLFLSNPVYFVSKAVGAIIAWMVYLGVGPDLIIGWEGGRLMFDLIAGGDSGSNLMSIFIVVGLAIPILTDFGLMEFLGVMIKKAVRFLFTLPGRSSIDLLGSWFSSSAASVIITRDQHEKGYYTGREAAAICVNFTLVSLPFTFVVASRIDLQGHFPLFYLIICFTAIVLAVIMPRIPPLSWIKDDYLPDVGKQIKEDEENNEPLFKQALTQATARASESTPETVIKSGLSNWLNIFMDLIPVILAWGTIAIIVEAQTPIFDWIGMPFGLLLNLLQVPYGSDFAAITVVGFVDMFLPAILLDAMGAPIQTSFILGALSIVQIIYLAETGILILKSKIPLHIGHLAILFIMRTVFALPIIVVLTNLLFNP